MDKNIELSLLLDFYGEILTSRQSEIVELYYNDNLSLSEIAQDLQISRQGVQDNLKRAEKTLYEMEEKLGLLEKFITQKNELKKGLEIISNIKSSLDNNTKHMVLEKLECLEKIIGNIVNR